MRRLRDAVVGASLAAAALGCDPDQVVLRGRPPPTPNEIFQRDLGKTLFFETLLSGPRDISCASCHVLFTQGAEPLALSIGTGATGLSVDREQGTGAFIARNSQDLFLRASPDLTSLFWDGRVSGTAETGFVAPIPVPVGMAHVLEVQALMPLLDRDEMRGRDPSDNELAAIPDDEPFRVWNAIMVRLMAQPGYRVLFSLAFPEVTAGTHDIRHVARALVAFQLSIWSRFDTAFDRTHVAPLPPDAEAGRALFFGDAGCARCHGGRLFSDAAFHNLAVPQIGPGKDPITHLDEGRFLVTRDPADRFAFRTPPLRNVALTGPYMHDGAFDRLEDAVRHHLDPEASLRAYGVEDLPVSLAGRADLLHAAPSDLEAILATADADAARPLRPLTDAEIGQLLAFLHALSSELELTVGPGDGLPLTLPSGLPIEVPSDVHPSRLLELGF